MDGTTEALAYAVDHAVRYYARRGAPASEEEMRQHAWQVAMTCVRTYDPERGDLRAYAFGAIRRSLGAAIQRWLGGRHFRIVENFDEVEGHLEADVPNPEQVLAAAQAEKARARWRVRFRRAFLAATASWSDEDRAAVEELYGLDGGGGEDLRPEAVAQKSGRPVEDLYVLGSKARTIISNSPTFYRLHKEA